MHIKDALAGATSFVPPGVVLMAAPTIEDMQDSLQKLLADADAIRNKASEEDRELTDDEVDRILQLDGEQDQIGKRIKALTPKQPQGQGRRSVPEVSNARPSNGGRLPVPAEPRVNDTRHGFASLGKWLITNMDATRGIDNDEVKKLRFYNTASTYGNESVGADGGYVVPPTFSAEIMQKLQDQENLMNRCTPLRTDGNSMMIPKDETTPWQTTGGVLVYWEGEGAAVTASKPLFEMGALRLSKLMALVPISEELMQDASGLESWIRAKAPAKMAAKINTSIIAGTGAGQPLGIIPGYTAVGASVIQVSKSTSQPADTVWMDNIEKMYARMYAPWRRNAIWLINQDIEPQLGMMAFQAAGATSLLPGTNPVPAYLPPGGLSGTPYGTLKGRPVVPIEACSAIGDLGDIIFVDLSQYWVLQKAGGIQTDTSIHIYFDQALTAFRFIFRINGQPAWSSTITRQNGSSNELSWAVTLQAR